jgi:hypothetical protein
MSDLANLLVVSLPLLTANGAAMAFGLRQIQKMSTKVRALEKENEILRAQVSAIVRGNGLALSIWTKGVDRRIRWASPRALRIIFAPLGMGEEDVMGRTFSDIFGEDVGRQIEQLDSRAMSELDSTQVDIIQLHPDLVPMVIIKTVTEDEDGRTVFQGIAIRVIGMDNRRAGENAQVLSRMVATDRASRRTAARDELGLPPENLMAASTVPKNEA